MQNCYFPNVATSAKLAPNAVLRADQTRSSMDQIRATYMQVGVIHNASGSAYVELQGTKVICAVYGPRNNPRGRRKFHEGGQLICDVKFAPFAERNRTRNAGQDPDEIDLSQIVTKALLPAIFLDKLPKCVVSCFVVILQSDGSELATAIMCASLALADAAIEMRDLVTACNAGIVDDKLLVDLCTSEERMSQGNTMLAFLPSLQKSTFVMQQGTMTHAQVEEMIDVCSIACSSVLNESMKVALTQKVEEDR
uniref:Exosome complex exonuclease MTR3like protein putativ n=1 Tax=Albugo laibachii Nc14 TaxID=890382 RepID=F0WFV6_9STRA|nr:exosome complex exonuclease MTR3like protein putativ [Albugo laibachii Nc14]|eukprot:CCA20090.1 exosome complex exonuclease MTR3like protein putativ [Albugo laibachii Nc14]